jgi:hypothetical protein
MPETSRAQYSPKDVDVEISEIGDGIIELQDLITPSELPIINF